MFANRVRITAEEVDEEIGRDVIYRMFSPIVKADVNKYKVSYLLDSGVDVNTIRLNVYERYGLTISSILEELAGFYIVNT